MRDSDATLVVSHGPLAGGSLLTLREAERIGRPVLHVDLALHGQDAAAARLREWLRTTAPATLNVAGPRASQDASIGDGVVSLLRAVLRPAPRGE